MATTSTYLRLTFQSGAPGGKDFIIRVPNPKEDLTAEQIQAAAATVMAKNVFSGPTGDLTALIDARIISNTVNDLV